MVMHARKLPRLTADGYYEARGQTSPFESKAPSKGRDNYDKYRNRDSGSSHRDDNKYDRRTDSRDRERSESRSKSSTSSLNHKKESGRVESSQRVDVHRPDRSSHRPISHRSERSQASDTYRSEGPRVEVYRSESHRQDSSRSDPHRSDVSRSEMRKSAQRPEAPRIDVERAESHGRSELPRQVVDSHSNHTVDSGAPQQALTEHEKQHRAEVRRTALRICDEWSEHLSSLGKPFFYNHLTGVSKWEKPKEWDDLKMVVTEIGRNRDRADQSKPAMEQPKSEGRNEPRHDGRGDGRREARPDQRSEPRPDTRADSRTDQVRRTSPGHHRRHSDHRHLQDNHRHRQDNRHRHRPRQAAPLNGCMPPPRQVELVMSVNRPPSRHSDDMDISPSSQQHQQQDGEAANGSSPPPPPPHAPVSNPEALTPQQFARQQALQTLQKLQEVLIATSMRQQQNLDQCLTQVLVNLSQTTASSSSSPPPPPPPPQPISQAVTAEVGDCTPPLEELCTAAPSHIVAATEGDDIDDDRSAGTPLSSPELHLPENGVLHHSPTPSQSSSQRGSVKGLVPAQAIPKQTTYALPQSLGNYYRPELTSHVQGWPSQQMERQADRLFRDGFNQSSYFNRVACELKNARSYVRVVEMQTKLQERKYLNLHNLIKQVVALPDGQILPDRDQH